MQEYLNAWRFYGQFAGRANRRDDWMVVLFTAIIVVGFALVSRLMFRNSVLDRSTPGAPSSY